MFGLSTGRLRVLALVAATIVGGAGAASADSAEERRGGIVRAIDLARTAIQVDEGIWTFSPSLEVITPAQERVYGLDAMRLLQPGTKISFTQAATDEGRRIERVWIHTR